MLADVDDLSDFDDDFDETLLDSTDHSKMMTTPPRTPPEVMQDLKVGGLIYPHAVQLEILDYYVDLRFQCDQKCKKNCAMYLKYCLSALYIFKCAK